jgi:hypothetical protein
VCACCRRKLKQEISLLQILPTPEGLESNRAAQSGLEGRERASKREKGGRGETIKASGDTERVKSRATANVSQQIKPSTSQEQQASIAISNHPQVKSNMPLSQ